MVAGRVVMGEMCNNEKKHICKNDSPRDYADFFLACPWLYFFPGRSVKGAMSEKEIGASLIFSPGRTRITGARSSRIFFSLKKESAV
jgi:hypothetical protein